MSTRGTDFLYKWIVANVPEIEEDTGSVYEAVLDAIVHHDSGLPQ
jgi:hypothetical protein